MKPVDENTFASHARISDSAVRCQHDLRARIPPAGSRRLEQGTIESAPDRVGCRSSAAPIVFRWPLREFLCKWRGMWRVRYCWAPYWLPR
jgi:hypothetical protein